MAPSVCQNSPKLPPHSTTKTTSVTQKSNCGTNSINGSMASYKMTSSENSWSQALHSKENQRPPVYNPEDYVQSLKKFGKRQSGKNPRSIYDTHDTKNANSANNTDDAYRSSTLPNKHSEYKSPIPTPPESDSEMSLRQFSSVTDLLTKLRADLRVSFPSFVQEFVATPSDGVSLLLEVLRAIQLSQAANSPMPAAQMTNSMPRNTQSYQRRALLDELACLQCISLCCSRSVEATARLGTTPIGLMPLASSATGQGIRARILAMQLMTAACDKNTLGHNSQKIVIAGHTAVSEAMSTLRLRCSEPVRFRLLIGMLNSGGGSGELQAVGVRFINTFLESAENLQQRLYLQAELFQAGFEPSTLSKTISSSSPWLDNLRNEIKHFNEIYVDVDKMLMQAREADRVRSQMVILERRVQILHEEKAVLTSMERRLQERCAELQREIFRLQGAQNDNDLKGLDKQPIALPRHVPPSHSKQDSSEHEDEGISSSETGPSLSPVPILVLPQKTNINILNQKHYKKKTTQMKDDETATIEDVMEELDNIVSEAEKQMLKSDVSKKGAIRKYTETKEKDIVPVNIVPQPPRKARSLAHIVSQPGGSELDGTEFGLLIAQQQTNGNIALPQGTGLRTFFDETDYDMTEIDKPYPIDIADIPEVNTNTAAFNSSTTRELLDVIMNARHTDDDPTIKALREANATSNQNNSPHNKRNSFAGGEAISTALGGCKKLQAPAQQFNGVFFMTGMNTPQKYPKPDLTAALQAKRVSKNVERLEAIFASHDRLNETNALIPAREKSRSNQQIYFGSNPTLRVNGGFCSYTNNITINSNITTRTRSYTQGSKLTDLPSGLY
ncbi:uncharacterized protein LOC119674778 [Teleopsis dalmanni]|uniref:uncharacterized protein LOC119674778 n=1 Tax=Teleopsis dalmanni TaxID=139649 RepID=UPI0018CE4612|nr:uncharacterized protein LOC119674778 [Teleopsis dalmanni]